MADQDSSSFFGGITLTSTPQSTFAGLRSHPSQRDSSASTSRSSIDNQIREDVLVNNTSNGMRWLFMAYKYRLLWGVALMLAVTPLLLRFALQPGPSNNARHPPSPTVDTCPRLASVINLSPVHVFDRSVYMSTVDEHTLLEMEKSWSDITLTVMDTSRPLGCLAYASEKSTRLSNQDQDKYHVFLDDVIAVQSQLEYTSLNISHLMDHYRLLRPQYHEHNSSAARALEVSERSGFKKGLIAGKFVTWAYLGVNFTKWYRDPWVKAHKTFKAAQLGVATFEGEMSKLESIAQVIQEVNHHLDRLAFVVFEDVVKGDCYSCMVRTRDILMLVRQLWGRLLAMGEE
ncbi:hypothetical protein HO133_000019 [Letharia lupina]|uniref:Uncharacterized protein n=1 Tax=Letharia lupina TaxID=560253 RepID=A0A8H6L091_9LECA|nr:uncharacterized protein HO133_000019 [Letharia lupina]KAF6230760.1 hypothetical protein HO133_000019 [Letharia lupina]